MHHSKVKQAFPDIFSSVFLHQGAAAGAALLFLAAALIPDERLIRLKLLWLEMGVLSLIAFWAAGAAWTGRVRLNTTAVLWSVAGWTVFVSLRGLLSGFPELAAAETRRAVTALGFFLLGSQLFVEEEGGVWVWRGWGAGAALIALYGLLQHSGGVGPLQVPRLDRVSGTFGNPIFFGAYLVLSVPILGHLARGEKGAWKGFWLAALGMGLAALYLTGSRAAWIGLGTAAMICFILGRASPVPSMTHTHQEPSRGSPRPKDGRGPPSSSGSIGRQPSIPFVVLVTIIAITLMSIFVWKTRDVWTRDQAHLLIWRDTLKLWRAHPLWGVGSGEFHIHLPDVAGDDLKAKWPEGKFIVNYAHSEPLQIAAELGVAGLGLWLMTFFLFFKSAVRFGHEPFLFCAAAGALAMSFFSVDLRFGVTTGLLYFLLGCATARDGRVFEKSWNTGAGLRLAGLVAAGGAAAFLAVATLHPYRAQRRQARQANFFDVKLLDPAGSIKDLEALSVQYPREASVFEKLGFVCAKEIKQGNALRHDMARKALAAYGKAHELDPARYGPINNMANIYFTLGDQEKAMAHWRKVLETNPGFLDARLNLGKVYYLRGQLKASADQFREVLRRDPGNDEATVYLKKMVE